MAEVHLILLPHPRRAHMELHNQDGQLVFWSKLRVGQGMKDAARRVNALAELCALTSCATEADSGNERGLARAVVHLPGVGDGIAALELLVHLTLSRIMQARDITDEEVRLRGDGLDELRQIFDQALAGHTEGLLENAAALPLVLREQERAVEGEQAGVDNGAHGHLRGLWLRGCGVLERGKVWLVPLEVEGETGGVADVVLDVEVELEPMKRGGRSAAARRFVVLVHELLLAKGTPGVCIEKRPGSAGHSRAKLVESVQIAATKLFAPDFLVFFGRSTNTTIFRPFWRDGGQTGREGPRHAGQARRD